MASRGIRDRVGLPPVELEALRLELEPLESLSDVIRWGRGQSAGVVDAAVITEVVVQDEFTHDAIVPWRGRALVFGSTCLGAIMAVAVWDHAPDADEILAARVEDGWQPTSSARREGDRVVGHAACLVAGLRVRGDET